MGWEIEVEVPGRLVYLVVEVSIGEDGEDEVNDVYHFNEWGTLPGKRNDCVEVSTVLLVLSLYVFAVYWGKHPKLVVDEEAEEGELGCVCRN